MKEGQKIYTGAPNVGEAKAIKEQSKDALKTDWIAFQSSAVGGADAEDWEYFHNSDVPDWAKEPEVIGKMLKGESVSKSPEEGSKWWRAVKVKPENTPRVN